MLTDLDACIGDGDHGINMDRGFNKVMENLPTLENTDIGNILKNVGMTLVSTVGGASGPLYGSAFLTAGMKTPKDKKELEDKEVVELISEAIDAIKKRGKATTGEKTMLDAIVPAYEILKDEVEKGTDLKNALDKAIKEAEKGVEYTKTIIATKGRASYLGERSLGHQDPGATSITLMLKAAKEVIN